MHLCTGARREARGGRGQSRRGARGAGGLGTGGPRAAGRDTPGEPREWAARVWRGGYTGNAVGVGGPGDGVHPMVVHPDEGGLRKYITWRRKKKKEKKNRSAS